MRHLAMLLPLNLERWFPPQASTVAADVDNLYWFIFWISLFFLGLITVLMGVFVWRYREREGRREGDDSAHHHLGLELAWSGIPLILVIVIFYLGFTGFMRMQVVPANAYEVAVTGQKWKWLFTYPNGYVDADLHVPIDRPVSLIMTSQDVIHSMFIPAFRVKRDVVPGRYSKLWFEATEEGQFPLYCAEYCGTSHSDMITKVVVHPSGEFEGWLENASNFAETLPPVEAGAKLYNVLGCATCHTIDGTTRIGPSFKGLFGHTQALKDGGSVQVDENYIRESILEPQSKVAAGFDPVMPTYQGRVKDKQIIALIEYIKSLE